MNKIERMVHSLVGDYPVLRVPIVFFYQYICAAIPSKNYSIAPFVQRPGFFYGFHDKQPWSSDSKRLLAHKFDVSINLNDVERGPIEVGYFNDGEMNEYIGIDTTYAWNWQQGSSLQWVGNRDSLIFNDIVEGQCVSKLVNIATSKVEILPHHLAAVSHSGKHALSISFSRFGRGMSGYGYRLTPEAELSEACPESLLLIDMETHAYKEVVKLEDVIGIDHQDSMDDSFHFFSHCLFSPDDSRFVFYHRWLHSSGRLETRLFSSDLSGHKLFLFNGSDFSHLAWCNNNDILSFAKQDHGRHGYFMFADRQQTSRPIGKDVLDSDGHPQCSKDGRYIVTDTYPDRMRNQFLKLFDLDAEKEIIVAKLRIPFLYRLERRCDFHPRLSKDNHQICFDSAHSGTRSLCVINNPMEME